MLNHVSWFGERKILRICFFLFSIFLLFVMIPTVYGFLWSESVNVEPYGRESLTFNRTYGKTVNVRLWSINGTHDDSINVWVTNPNGYTILNLGRVRVTDKFREFEFVTLQDGVYTVHFDNSFSSSPKTVEYMFVSYTDTLLPAYYVALAMWIGLPPLVKHILGYGWFTTLAISFGITVTVMLHLFVLLYNPII